MEKRVAFSLRIPAGFYREVKACAQAQDRSITNFVVYVLRDWMTKRQRAARKQHPMLEVNSEQ